MSHPSLRWDGPGTVVRARRPAHNVANAHPEQVARLRGVIDGWGCGLDLAADPYQDGNLATGPVQDPFPTGLRARSAVLAQEARG